MRVSSITDLVPWLCPVSDGVVACKDGSLLACFEITGRDTDSASDAERQVMLERAASLFSELSVDPWTIVFTLKNCDDLEYPYLPMTLDAASALDEQHRAFVVRAASIRPRAFLTLMLAPPSKDDRFFGNIAGLLAQGEPLYRAIAFGVRSMFVGKHAFAYRAQELAIAVQRIESVAQRFVSVLPDWGLKRLVGPHLTGFLRSLVSGHNLVPNHAVHSPNWFLDSELADSELQVFPDHLKLGDYYVGGFSIRDWPQATDSAFVQNVVAIGVPSTLSVTFKLMNKEESKATIKKIQSYAELTQYGIKDYVKAIFAGSTEPDESKGDREKKIIIRDAEAALEEMAVGSVAFGHMNVSLAIYAKSKTELDDVCDFVYKNISPIYPGIVREKLHLLGCWAATLPGQIYEPVRWSLMHTGNLADCAPVFLPVRGEPVNRYFEEQRQAPSPALSVFPAAYGGHYYFNFHRGALGHTFVIGGSRSGKSVMMNFLISQFTKYQPCRVIIFDKDHSCRINTLMHDGSYFDLGRQNTDGEANGQSVVRLNPLSLIGDPIHWEFLVRWLVDLVEGKDFKTTTEHETLIREAIEGLYRIDKKNWRLGHLSTLLPLDLQKEIEPFIAGGQYGDYFDNEEDSFSLSTITAFEMGELLSNPRVGPLAVSYAFYRIQRILEENRRPGATMVPTLIYLEECWYLFENETFQSRVRDWLKTLAKYGAFVVMATQSIEDMVSDNRKLFSSIRDNIATMIFLPNARANAKSVFDVYKREFALPDEVIHEIATSVVRRDYIVVNDDHIKKISCIFSPRQLAYLRSDSLALSILNEEIKRGGDWKGRYLARIAH